MAETINISELAHEVSNDIFSWFKWKEINLYDENFSCRKSEEHFPKKIANSSESDNEVESEQANEVESEKSVLIR